MALAWWLTRAGFDGTHAGLALAISVAAIVNAWLLYRGLKRDGVVSLSAGWSAFLVRVVVANVAMVVCLQYLDRPLDWWLAESVWSRSIWLGTIVCSGAFVYFAMLIVAGGRPSQLGHRSG